MIVLNYKIFTMEKETVNNRYADESHPEEINAQVKQLNLESDIAIQAID